MVHERRCLALVIIKRSHLVQNGYVAGLTNVSAGTCDEPQGIIIEAATDVGVTLLGKWLILVISTTILELS